MKKLKRFVCIRASAGVAFACFTLNGFAVDYTTIDLSKSKINFTTKLMGSNLKGEFGKFSGNVVFNPDQPEKAKVNLMIDIASFSAGGEELQEEAKGKDWFNTKIFPVANFVSDSVKVIGIDKLEIHGLLTIKGKTVPITAQATHQRFGNDLVFDASLKLLRLQYALGEGTWGDPSTVSNEVPVNVHLVLNKK